MNKLLLFACFFIYGLTRLQADLFLIENPNDIERVTNTFIYFYCQNHQELKNLKSQNFKKALCKKFLQKLKFEHPENPLCHIEDKQQAKKNFFILKQYVKANANTIKDIIGEKKYNLFFNGLFYVHYLLKSL